MICLTFKQFTFNHLSQQHLERLQQMREELERTLELQHKIDNGHMKSLKDYWLVGEHEKNLLRYKVGVQE